MLSGVWNNEVGYLYMWLGVVFFENFDVVLSRCVANELRIQVRVRSECNMQYTISFCLAFLMMLPFFYFHFESKPA